MSMEAVSWAMNQQKTRDRAARHVLLILANFANEYGDTCTSVPTIERLTGMSRSTIAVKLSVLRSSGLIEHGNQKLAHQYADHGGHAPNVYRLRMDRESAHSQAVANARARSNPQVQLNFDARPPITGGLQ